MGNQQVTQAVQIVDKQLQQENNHSNSCSNVQQSVMDNQTQQNQFQNKDNPNQLCKNEQHQDLQKLLLQVSFTNNFSKRELKEEVRKPDQEKTIEKQKLAVKIQQQLNQSRSIREDQFKCVQSLPEDADSHIPLQQQTLIDSSEKREIKQEKSSSQIRNKQVISLFTTCKGQLTIYQRNTIEIQQEGIFAIQKGVYYDNQKIILSSQIHSNHAQCSFKIQELKYCVGFGIAFKEVIERHEYNYKSQENELGHGLYIVTTQGFSWSHSQKDEDDIFHPDFKSLYPGATVTVTLHGQIIRFKWKKAQFCVSIKSQLVKKHSLHFCAYLHEKGDSVSIVQM